MSHCLRTIFFICFLSIIGVCQSQKVGLVLSGGGALGYAHIGVLKALEENEIPVDYITGTSAGALVGGLYSAGWAPEVIDSIVMTDKYQLMSTGGIEKEYDHFFRKQELDPSWINIKMTNDFSLTKIIPTNFINPTLLDFESMAVHSGMNASIEYNFDSLFVPFRCVAADVTSKSPVIFDKGHLNQAVRASMTYPGYLKPIKVDGRLMFDGGLYNNFPTDVMYDDFYPDIIIGVNFTDTTQPPDQDDILSQLKAMIIDRDPTSIICENGIMIEPDEPISLFGFDEGDKAIQAGYDATMAIMDSIKMVISRRVPKDQLDKKRHQFLKNYIQIFFDEIEISGVSVNVADYIKKALFLNEEMVDIHTMKKRYFRLMADYKINFAYPIAEFKKSSGRFKMILDVHPEKPFALKFGGVFSSKPINTGYIDLNYHRLGKIGLNAFGESHFGKYYGSAKVGGKLDFNFKLPFSVQGSLILNRFDFFRSFTTFFEESKPSFIVENEIFGNLNIITPISYFGKFSLGFSQGVMESQYYQSDEFTPSDTTDRTSLNGYKIHFSYSQSSLNRKQFASEGTSLNIAGYIFNGVENTTPGSTSVLFFPTTDKKHQFFRINLDAQKYVSANKRWNIGGQFTTNLLLSEKLLANYTASAIASPSFKPTVESRAMFIDYYATHYYSTLALKSIFELTENIDLRIEATGFQPFYPIEKNAYNQPFLGEFLGTRYYSASSIIVYHSPLGPLSANVNYYHNYLKPFSFLVSFGYVIHNKRFLK